MTKKELKGGMFGVMSDDEIFVVAGDKLIYEGGQYNNIADMSEDMMFGDDGVVALYEARCFQQVKDGRGKLIWKRPEEEEDAENVPTGEGKVTITEEQFLDAVKKANEKFMEISKKCPTPCDDVINIALGLQNMTFGALVGAVLFNKEID